MPPHKMHHRGFFPENGGNGMTELIFWLTVGILFCLGLVQVIGYVCQWMPVSYTHLDVYKRQPWVCAGSPPTPEAVLREP